MISILDLPTLMYIYMISFFYKIWCFFNINNLPSSSSPEEEVKDETQLYIEKNKNEFLELFPLDEESKKTWNSNIDERCYSLETFEKLVIEDKNELEPEWKRRLMYENTPRGNIIMYYDIYKQAFAYVSDQHINYSILNACAMKYVRLYRCLDFFVDVHVLPEGVVSPFSLMQEEADRREKEKSKEKKKELGIDFKDAPFAKLKTYRDPNPNLNTKENKENNDKKIETTPKLEYKNNFRYLGKISNLSILQKPDVIPVKQNPLISVPIDSFDYLAYKNMYKKKWVEEEETKDYLEEKLIEEKSDGLVESEPEKEYEIEEFNYEYNSDSPENSNL